MHRAHRFLGLLGAVSIVVSGLVGCAGEADSPSSDAGPEDGAKVARDAAGVDAGAHPDASIDGGATSVDATVGGGGDDASNDAAARSDAQPDASTPDGSLPSIDASTSDASIPDASTPDASIPDASPLDASVPDAAIHDASVPDAAIPDASDAALDVVDAGAPDASIADAAIPDAAIPDVSSPDSASDAAACNATCASGLSFLGNSAAFITGDRALNLLHDTVPAGSTVSAITQSYPAGAAQSVHAVYTTDAFVTSTDVTLTYDHPAGNNDQWYVVLPAQSAGSTVTVTWYLYAVGCDCARIYDSASGQNFTYVSK